MKTRLFTVLAILILCGVCHVQAEIWTEGYHQINPGEVYGEVGIYNDVRLDIFGGEMYYLFSFDTTLTNWYSGQMSYLRANNDSVVNIFGGNLLDFLYAGESSQINLYAYDVTYNDVTHFIEGNYYKDNSHFSFELLHGQDTYSHIVVVPEPSTMFLLSLGYLLLRNRKK